MSTIRNFRVAGVVVGLLLAAACGSDTVTSPIFGAGCQKGTLQPGDTIIGAFTTSSCQMAFDWYSNSHAPYVGYTVNLTKGKAYHVLLEHIPDTANANLDGLDARLTLWTRNSDGSSIPLAASDDDAGNLNSEIWFVAPVGGTFELVAASYSYGDLGGFRLEMNECPVLGVLDTVGTYSFTLAPSPCWRHRAGNNSADTSGYSFVSLQSVAGEQITTTVTSAAFNPAWEEFGPGFDVYGKIYNASRWAGTTGGGNSLSITLDPTLGGQVTIGIGGSAVDTATGAFSITLGRVPPPAPPAPGSTWSLSKLLQMTRRAPEPKTHH